MDLGIAGRKAIVCASSRGLGRACAFRLAEAGCEVVVNGRDQAKTEGTAAEIAKATGAKVIPVIADVATAAGQAALFAAMPEPDILVNNNAGPPFRDFRELDRQKMIDGVVGNMIVAIELIQKVIDPMSKRKFGRIVNITSGSVRMPLGGLDLSSGARAGLTAFLAGVARQVAANNVTINFLLPGSFDDRPARVEHAERRQEPEHHGGAGQGGAHRDRAGETLRRARRVRRGLRVPLLGACRLHHRAEPLDGRRRLSRARSEGEPTCPWSCGRNRVFPPRPR